MVLMRKFGIQWLCNSKGVTELGRKFGISDAGMIEWGLVGFCLSSSGPRRPVAFPIVVIQSPSRDHMRVNPPSPPLQVSLHRSAFQFTCAVRV